MKRSLFFIWLVLLVSFPSLSSSADIDVAGLNTIGIAEYTACDDTEENGTICVTLLVSGEIVEGDAAALRQFVYGINTTPVGGRKAKVGMLFFDSPGGSVEEAIKIGEVVRKNLITTQVTHDSECYSSCVIAFLGGVIRMPVGPVGIHSFYSEDFLGTKDFAAADVQYNKVSVLVEEYLDKMRIPTSLLDEMKKVPHYNLKILDFDDLERLGVLGVDPVYAQTNMSPPKNFFDQFD